MAGSLLPHFTHVFFQTSHGIVLLSKFPLSFSVKWVKMEKGIGLPKLSGCLHHFLFHLGPVKLPLMVPGGEGLLVAVTMWLVPKLQPCALVYHSCLGICPGLGKSQKRNVLFSLWSSWSPPFSSLSPAAPHQPHPHGAGDIWQTRPQLSVLNVARDLLSRGFLSSASHVLCGNSKWS